MILIGHNVNLLPLFLVDITNPDDLSNVFRENRVWLRVPKESIYQVRNELRFGSLDI